MKIAVYAICKDESQFVDRWAESVQGADEVVVLDTGSQDDSAQRLRGKGFSVYEERFTPWRFDVARNRSLDLVSEAADVCLCLDLDETLPPDWREQLERAWHSCDQLEYLYVWSLNPDGSDGVTFFANKIHARHGFRWIHPVHEVLRCDRTPRVARCPSLRVVHRPDPSKSRAQYLPLLELAVREDPQCDRNVHYLGREYLFHGRWQECIDTLSRHVRMPEATWADEKCASFRYMARAYQALDQLQNAERCLLHAAATSPGLREPWVALGVHCYQKEDWLGTACCMRRALCIETRPGTYLSEPESWGALPWDLLSLALYHLGQHREALDAVRRAILLAPDDERLTGNLRLMQEEAKSPSVF